MAGIKKKESGGFKDKFSTKTKYKDTSYYFCGDAFLSASGLPGPVMGGINMFLGHSNSSKTTAMILAAADAQKKGHLPVFIITEKKWSWEHAVELGLDAKKSGTVTSSSMMGLIISNKLPISLMKYWMLKRKERFNNQFYSFGIQ